MATYITTAFQLLLPFIAAGIITLFYLPVYKRKINERLGHFGDDDMTTARPITSPVKFFLRTLLIVFIIFIASAALLAFFFVGVKNSGTSTVATDNKTASEVYINNVISPSLLDSYTPGDEIPGYRITDTLKQGDFEIYYYALPDEMYSGFPDGFIGMKYTGSGDVTLGMSADPRQESDDGILYGSVGFAALPAPVEWFSVDVTNFFGTLDITAFAMTEESMEKYSKLCRETDRNTSIEIPDYADTKEKFTIDLAEAYEMTDFDAE